MRLNCKRIDFEYMAGEGIFTFPEETGLPFIFDLDEELTADSATMDAVGKMLDEVDELTKKAKAAIRVDAGPLRGPIWMGLNTRALA